MWFPSHHTWNYAAPECVIWLVPLTSPNCSAHTVVFSWTCDLTCSSCHTPSFSSPELMFLLNVIWLVPLSTPHLSPHPSSCFSWMWFDLSHSRHPIYLLTPAHVSPECDLTCPSRHTPSFCSPRLTLLLNVWFVLSLLPHPIFLLTLMYSSLECVIWLVPCLTQSFCSH